jgi:hypothetical protein
MIQTTTDRGALWKAMYFHSGESHMLSVSYHLLEPLSDIT